MWSGGILTLKNSWKASISAVAKAGAKVAKAVWNSSF